MFYRSCNSTLSKRKCIVRILRSNFSHSTASTAQTVNLIESEISNNEHLDHVLTIQNKNLNPNTSIHVLDLTNKDSSIPNRALHHSLLKKCTQFNKLKEGKSIHGRLLIFKFQYDVVMVNTLLNMYSKCGSMNDAQNLFDETPEKDFVTWTVMISGYSQNDRQEDALNLFTQMIRFGFEPNQFTLSSVLKAAAFGSRDQNGQQIHGFCVKYGYDSNVYVGSSILDMYTRCNQMDDAKRIFDGLDSKNEVSWNALIAGHARKGEAEKALSFFGFMMKEDYEPTHFTYSSVFGACASTGFSEQGKWVHAHMIKSGGKLVAFAGNTLLDMYAKSGNIEDARKVFERLVKRELVSWNSMLAGYAQHGFGKEAVCLFEEMLNLYVTPNHISFLCVLTACSHSGLLDKGLYYFDLMKMCNVESRIEHYVTIVDLLGRAGLFDKAKNFINEMPKRIKPTSAIWKTLLGACRMHKNMELGVYAAERVFELDPNDSGPHVLLYNIYASANRWDDAAKVRKVMRDNGVKKEPACSWVEIENKVHVFIANDDAHPQRDAIVKKWEEISAKIKGIGYVPDVSHVLLFVEQREREVKLQYHSEKLALAFALLNTSNGSTIHIKKNIRVCGDCHSAIKFVSKVVERVIVVRDTNRFHHFRDGSCSCGDYW